MVNTFFSSDHHFNHKNILHLCNRPFESIEEMNEVCIERWNSMEEETSPFQLLHLQVQ